GIKTSLENVVSAVTGTDVSTGETLTAYERGERLGAFFIDALTAKIAVDGAGRPTRGTAPGQPASGAEKGGSCGGGGGTLTNADLKASAIGDHNQTGLSKAARAWDKHAAKEGSAIEKATGGVDAKNARASEFVDSVLNDPARTVDAYTHPNYGDIIDIRKPDGSGLRYNQDGSFMGFLDPSNSNK
ncbi:MAG: hypothetical protein ACK5QX_00655, partial [bacterium]